MVRYRGEGLPPQPRVALVSNDALGNYVVATPLLRMIRDQLNPSALHYYGGNRTEELWRENQAIDAASTHLGQEPSQSLQKAEELRGGDPYDLVVNLEAGSWTKAFTALLCGPHTQVVGPTLGVEGRGDLPMADDAVGRLAADPDWTAEDLVRRYPFLKSGFIAEIFARLAYLPGDVPGYELSRTVPTIEVPPVLIATAASLEDKLWPVDRWREAIDRLGIRPGLLGAKPSDQKRYWRGDSAEEVLVEEGRVIDLRGQLSLPEVVGAIEQAQWVLTLDNGILHLAAATKTPTVGLFRYGIHRLWSPPVQNIRVVHPAQDQRVADLALEPVLEAAAWAKNAR